MAALLQLEAQNSKPSNNRYHLICNKNENTNNDNDDSNNSDFENTNNDNNDSNNSDFEAWPRLQ